MRVFNRWGETTSAVMLVVVCIWGCNVQQPTTTDDDQCVETGGMCDADRLCCATLTCSNGFCFAPVVPAGTDEPSALALADFSAEDVNPQSLRYQQPVSPRDYLGQVSAWYFGHST